ncbi:RWD-domain-containing protein [Hypomontagnella submonticulosa]|nr:RWD-domain-containing protein [Hypomontagnella submonticulosa]
MGKEEQVEEREVLDSIFPDEITDISETEYRISVKLDLLDDDNNGDEASEPPTLILHVRYPDDYPDEAPMLDLSPPQNAPPHPHFSVAADKGLLLKGLESVIEENMGMAMVFTLVTTLKEEAEQLIAERKAAAAAVREEAILAAEREENKKFHGTPVTPETFMKWREGFMKEMAEKEQREEEERLAELKKAKVKEPVRLTGRQLWERGLAKGGEEGEDEENAPPTEQVERLQIEAS